MCWWLQQNKFPVLMLAMVYNKIFKLFYQELINSVLLFLTKNESGSVKFIEKHHSNENWDHKHLFFCYGLCSDIHALSSLSLGVLHSSSPFCYSLILSFMPHFHGCLMLGGKTFRSKRNCFSLFHVMPFICWSIYKANVCDTKIRTHCTICRSTDELDSHTITNWVSLWV